MANFNQAIDKLLLKEGGATLINHKYDKGGLTKFGISSRSYPNLDIANLNEAKAAFIYKRDYWDKLNLDLEENQLLANFCFECAVNIGVNSFKKILSLTSVNGLSTDEQKLLELKLAMVMRYAHICNRNKTQKVFLLGWLNRVLN